MSPTRHRSVRPIRTDQQLLRRAWLVVALQTGLGAAAVLAVVVTAVYAINQRATLDATEAKARDKIVHADEYGVDEDDAEAVILHGLPAGCDAAVVRVAARGLPAGSSRLEACGSPFLAYVGTDEDGRRITVMVSFVEQQEESQRLAMLSVLVGGFGVLAAGALGGLFGRRAVRPLGAALESQRRFVADAGHELRTPIAILLTRAQLLSRGPVHDDEQRRELGQLVREVRVLGDVVNDLLLVAEMQHYSPRHELVDLGTVAEEVRSSYAVKADHAGVELSVVRDESPDYPVDGVATALRRALAGLVDNALQHSHPGGHVIINLRVSHGHILAVVVDDGSGLDPTEAAELTRRFRRGAHSVGESGRLGLGLALVQEICQAHRGSMRIEGALGRGARVSLRFPRASERH